MAYIFTETTNIQPVLNTVAFISSIMPFVHGIGTRENLHYDERF
jgi:hypothetical protein